MTALSFARLAPSRRSNRALSAFVLVPLFLALTAGCSGDGTQEVRPPFVIAEMTATPERGFLPAEAEFNATLAWDEDVTPDPDAVLWRWEFGDGSVDTNTGERATHTFINEGTFTVSVEAWTEEARRPVRFSRTFRVDRPGDLSVVSVGITPLSLSADQAVTASVTLRAADVPSDLVLPVSFWAVPEEEDDVRESQNAPEVRDALQAAGAVELFRAEVVQPADAPEEWTEVLEAVTFPEDLGSGRYRILGYVDIDGRYAETNDRNNGRFAPNTILFRNPVADARRLNVRNVRARPARANLLNRVTYDFEIVNGGTADAVFVEYEVWLTRGSVELDREDDRLLQTGEFPNLPPGAPLRVTDETVEFTPPITSLGEYFVVVTATTEAAGKAGEVRGSSNAIVVTDEEIPGIDIVPTALGVSPSVSYLGGTVSASATILNQGSEDVPRSFQCALYLMPTNAFQDDRSDLVIGAFTVRALAANESLDVETVATIPGFLDTGTWYPYLYCNPNALIPEADRSNNVLRAPSTLQVNREAVIDLAITRAEVTPMVVQAETPVQVLVEVCNNGSSGSTPTRLHVQQSLDNTRSAFDRLLFDVPLPPIEAGECLVLQEEVIADCDTFVERYTLFAVADPGELVPEAQRTNNVRTIAGTFRVTGPFCVCEPDPYEPNNTGATASLLNPSTERVEGLTMCDEAVDWYRIPLLRGESVRVTMQYTPRRGNLDLTLYGPDRTTVLDTSRRNGGTEEVSFFVLPSTGDYYLKVEGRTPEDRNRYTLELSVTPPISGIDLTVFDVVPDRDVVVPGEVVDVRFTLVNLGDTPAPPQLVRILWTDDPQSPPTEGALLDEFTAGVIVDRLALTRAIEVPRDDEGGERFVQVLVDAREEIDDIRRDNNTGVSDGLLVDAGCADAFEPNNSLSAATELEVPLSSTGQVFENLRSCTGNPDFYRVCADSGEALQFRVDFDRADGDLDLRLFDEQQRVIARSETLEDFEEIAVPWVNASSCYTLEVYVVGVDRNVAYSLAVTRETADPALACNTRAEPNNSIVSAPSLRDHLMEDLAICPEGDEDFFRVTLTGGQPVRFRLRPASDADTVPSSLRLSLFGPSQNFLGSTVTATEDLRYTAPISGTHTLRVRSNGAGGRSQAYRIEAEGLSGVDLAVTELTAAPATLSPGLQTSLSWILSNSRTTTAPESTTAIYLSPVPFLDDRATLLRTLTTAPVAGLSSRAEGTKVGLPAGWTATGTHYLLVRADDGQVTDDTNRSNNLQATPLTITGLCEPDAAEPNSVYLDAFPIADLFEDELLTLCPGDEDWFRFEAPADTEVGVRIEFEHALGDLDMTVHDATLAVIATGDSTTDNEEVVFTTPASGRYYVRVYGFGPFAQNSYALQVSGLP